MKYDLATMLAEFKRRMGTVARMMPGSKIKSGTGAVYRIANDGSYRLIQPATRRRAMVIARLHAWLRSLSATERAALKGKEGAAYTAATKGSPTPTKNCIRRSQLIQMDRRMSRLRKTLERFTQEKAS